MNSHKNYLSTSFLLIYIFSIFLLFGCGSGCKRGCASRNDIWGTYKRFLTTDNILSFNLLNIENADLSSDVIGIVGTTTVDLTVPNGTLINALVVDITTGNGASVVPSDGDTVSLDVDNGKIKVKDTEYSFPKLPDEILAIRDAGGLLAYTRNKLEKRENKGDKSTG